MKMGICKTTILAALLICACTAVIGGCRSDPETDGSDGSSGVVVPHGYMSRLEQVHDGRMIGFGPFVGYYFRPEDPGDLSRLRFVGTDINTTAPTVVPQNAFYVAWRQPAETLFPLVFLWRHTDNKLKLRIVYADDPPAPWGLFDDYELADMTGLDKTDLRWWTVTWSESAGLVKCFLGAEGVSSQAILNNMTRGAETRLDAPASLTATSIRYSALRRYNIALDANQVASTVGPLEYGSDDPEVLALVNSWRYESRPAFASVSVVVDHVADTDFYHQASAIPGSSLDGDAHQAGAIIPALFGTAFNVPMTEVDARNDRQIAGVSASVERVYSQAVGLQKDVSPGNHSWRVDGLANTIRPAGATPAVFGWDLVEGQELTLGGGTFAGDVVVKDILPSRYSALRRAGSTVHQATVEAIDITPDAAPATATFNLSASSSAANWDDAASEDNPYKATGNGECTIVTFRREVPQPCTCDAVGDPTILASSPPGSGYVPPDYAENVIAQQLKLYGPQWTTELVTPVYASSGSRVGYYVPDERSTEQAVNDVAQGALLWVEEDGTGTSTIRRWRFPEAIPTPDITITEGSVVSVSRVERAGSNDRFERLEGLRVLYNKAWLTMDASSVPGFVAADVRAFVTNEYRKVDVGDTSQTADVPVFPTFELRRGSAKRIGEDVLRISRGTQWSITARFHRIKMLRDFFLGARIDGDLPGFGLPGLVGICTGFAPAPFAGNITFNVWTETTL